MPIVEFDYECPACKGTGLYKGIGEGDGFAVVCARCNGTGKAHFRMTYQEFRGRHSRDDVNRVLETNPGLRVSVNTEEGLTHESFGGMSYADWAAGLPFPPGSEMRNYTCPAWWYQLADSKKKPHWDQCPGCGIFCNCPHFPNKAACWARWDQEYSDEVGAIS